MAQPFTHCVVHNAAKTMFAYAKEIGLIEINPIEASFTEEKAGVRTLFQSHLFYRLV